MKKVILINPRLAKADSGTFAHAIADYGMPDAAEIIYHGRNVLASLENAGLCIKSFRPPGFLRGLWYRYIGTPKARRAYYNALRLRELGISTPEPVMDIETYGRTGKLERSYYICSLLKGYRELRGVEKLPEFPALARALAAFLLRMHDKGVYMVDCTPGNILYRRADDGKYDFMLVDVNRMRFGVTEWDVLLTNFRALLDTREATVEVARHYCELLTPGMTGDVHPHLPQLAARIYDEHQRRLMRKKHFKDLLRHKKK